MKTLILDSEVPDYPIDIIEDAPLSGPFDDYAEFLVNNFEIQADHAMIKRYLKECGAWSKEELENIDDNVKRFLWVTILNEKELKNETL